MPPASNDPREHAVADATTLIARACRGPLTAPECQRLVAHVVSVAPGLLRQAAHALSAQRDAAAVDALMSLPGAVPGVVEGVYGAVAHGVRRRRRDDQDCAAMLAMDFRRSRAKAFEGILERARRVFGNGLEQLTVGNRTQYRFALREGRGTLAGRVAAATADVQWLHARLAKLKGTRLWLNGWRFDAEGPIRAPAQVHLVQGWLSWAASQTETRRR